MASSTHERVVKVYPTVRNKLLLLGYCADKKKSQSGLVDELIGEFFNKLPATERNRLIQYGKAVSRNSY